MPSARKCLNVYVKKLFHADCYNKQQRLEKLFLAVNDTETNVEETGCDKVNYLELRYFMLQPRSKSDRRSFGILRSVQR